MFTKSFSDYSKQQVVPEAIFTLNHKGYFISVNETAVEMFGYAEKDLLGKFIWTAFPEAMGTAFYNAYEQSKKGRKHIYLEEYNTAQSRWFEHHFYQTVDRILICVRDITEQKKTEQFYKYGEEKWRKLVNSIPDFIALHDLEGNCLFLNHYATGFSEKDILGKSLYNHIADDSKELFRQHFQQCIQKNQKQEFIYKAHGDNNLIKTYESYLVPITGKEEEVVTVMVIAKDITDRIFAENQLKANEHFLSETQRISKIGSYQLDLIKGEWDSSRELKTIFGIEGKGKRAIDEWVSYLHPDWKKEMQEYLLQEVIAKHQRFDKEYKVINQSNGKEYWVHGIGDLEFDANGLPVSMMGTIQDITEKKEAEELLQAKEKLYKALIENSNDGVVILDSRGIIRYVAPSITRVLGYTEKDVFETNLLSIAHPDDVEELQNIFKKVLSTPGLHHTEFIPRIKHKDGTWRWIAGTLNNLLNDKVIHGIVENFRDVTEQVIAQEAIKESENKYHSLVENAGDAIAVYETSGKILDVNATGINMLGYSKKEILQMKVTDFFTAEEMQSVPMMYNVLKPGESSLRIRNFKAKDGRLLLTEVRSQMLPDGLMLSIIRDISEREQAREELRKSNENYSALVNTIEGIVWEADAKTAQFNFVSKQAEQILGYPAEQWTEQDFWPNHVYEPDREWAVSYCVEFTQKKQSHDFEYRMVAADGRIVWLHDIVTVVVENNEAVKMRGLMIDITERKIMERGLEDYKFALNQSSIVDIADSKGNIQYANENFCKISGYTIDELRGKGHRILKSGYHTKEHYQSLWNTVLSGNVWRNEVKNKAKDGSFYWVDSTIIPFLDDEGKPSQFITIRSDITKRKEAETQIHTTLERYDILSNATRDTIWDWDIVNNNITYNRGISKNFGYKLQKVKNTKEWWEMNIHPEDRSKVTDTFQQAFFKKKTIVQMEYRFRSAKGEYRHILDRAFIIYDSNKHPQRMIGSMQDISTEKELAIRIENEVIDAQEREWNQIGMDLHDNVNQILAASMLLMGLGKERMEKGQNAAAIIQESEKHVGEAIAEIRRLSHQLAPVSVENLSLEQIFQTLIETVNVNKKFKVKLNMNAISEIRIPQKLQINLYRILQSQLSNIIKYASASKVIISFKKQGDSIVFKIADNGIGFDPTVHSSGIGLENINRRAKVFAGEFKLNTSPGKGCEVLVKIPLKSLN